MRHFSDEEVLEGIIQERKDVLKHVYTVGYKNARHFVVLNGGSELDAEDVFHEALIVIFLQLRDKKLSLSCAFTTYLYSIVRLLWLSELRRRGRRCIAVGDCEDHVDLTDDYYKSVEEYDRKALVLKCFNQLSENCQKVLGLFMTGHSIAEVTRAMGF
jgi:DNA-directed RNA polymerase specialized sigma24 family protein